MRNARLWALLLLAGPVAYQVAHTVDSLHVYSGGPESPFAVAVDTRAITRLTPAATSAGLAQGDVLLTVNGGPYHLPVQVYSYLRKVKAGARLDVTYSRSGAPPRAASITLASAYPAMKTWQDLLTAIFADFLTRWTGLLLGCFVVLVRPRDPLAWLVFCLMASFGQLATGVGQVAEGWAQPWRSLGSFYKVLANLTWPVWMLLFGLYFPDPRSSIRLFHWSRWAIAAPIFSFALLVAFLDALEQTGRAFPEWIVPALRASNNVLIFLIIGACGLFFANISYKAAREPLPDARRRLRLLFWGTNLSMSPLFLLVLWARFTGGDLGSQKAVLLVPSIAALFLFPVTLGYVIVVGRAMDVRVVLRQGLQYALAQRAVRIATALVMLLVVWIAFREVGQGRMKPAQQLRVIAFAMLATVLVQRGAGKARAWVDRRFFRQQVEAEQVLAALSDEVRRIADAEELKRRVCGRISAALHVERVEITSNGAGEGWELAIPLSTGADTHGHLALGPKRNEEPYSRSDRRLLETVAAQTALALENARLTREVAAEAARRERIHRELEIAREVQERLFPQHPPGVAGLDYTGVCRPAQSIGGDYYDFFLSSNGQLTLAVGDICGKGVPAALLMAGVQASLRGLCAGGVRDLGELLTHLNALVFDATPRNRFATLWCGQYDPATRILRYSSAGHGDALVARAGGALEHASCRGLALGLVRHARYEFGSLELHPGDLLAVCTDGVTEARSASGDEFGEDAWARLVDGCRGMAAAAVVGRALQQLDEFARGAEQHDDITLVAARVL